MRSKAIFSLIVLSILAGWVYPANSADPIALNSTSISITKGPLKWNKSTSQWETVVTLKNVTKIKNNKKFYGPFQLVPHFDLEDVELLNSGGLTADSKSYVQVNVPKEGLAPGQKIKKIPLQFKTSTQKRFKLSYSLMGYANPEDAGIYPGDPPDGPISTPKNLELNQTDYRASDGSYHYDVDISWQHAVTNLKFEVNWQVAGDGEQWQSIVLQENTYNYKITNVHPGSYVIRVRALDQISSQKSKWLQGEIKIIVIDYPPNPPTDLVAASSRSGVGLNWKNPTDGDFAGVEIWVSKFNYRAGGIADTVILPSAQMLTRLSGNVKSYFYNPGDYAWRFFWIRAYDESGNYSTWERPGENDGVSGRAGIHGDGNPPPAPISLKLVPDTWQCTISWEQGQDIPDLFGTEIYYSKINDRSQATMLGVSNKSTATQLRLESGITYYYWVRNVDLDALKSPFYPDSLKGMPVTIPLGP